MKNGEEIQRDLRELVTRWERFQGSERSEAQTFINELFASYGTDRMAVGARFEDSQSSTGIMDVYWPNRVIIEMKRPSEAVHLSHHRRQALDYWRNSSDVTSERPAPPYVVLSAFHKFEVWQPGLYPTAPRAVFSLTELPEQYESLLFLASGGQEAIFSEHRELTKSAVALLADLYGRLTSRQAAEDQTVRYFLLQTVWCLFAESFGMLAGRPIEKSVDRLLRDEELSSWMVLGGLFEALNDPTDYGRYGILAQTPYVNGGLFEQPARVHLLKDELELLREATKFEWHKVNPTIFGSLVEGLLAQEHRGALGVHYTHESDIMKIVRPTVVDPWRQRIEAAATPQAAYEVLTDLCGFRVLDPACGCGNFLYVAYRELRGLESALKRRILDLAGTTGLPAPSTAGLFYPLRNLRGLDIEQTAVLVTRLVLWMAHRQMVDLFGEAEPVLPLTDLSSIRKADALRVDWPESDCVVGNPPFLGSQNLRASLGDEYLKWLDRTFEVGLKDLCVYWFRRTQDHLKPGQRAGLVGTNSVSQNRARSASLEYVTSHGGVITDAVSTQKWPGEAKVHVSLVNWVKEPAEPVTAFRLDGAPVTGITAELRAPGRSTEGAQVLAENRRRCFQGVIPVGDGFVLGEAEARSLLTRTDAEYRDVIRPYLIGDDIADDPAQGPRRWIVDFAQRPLEDAMRYPAAVTIVRERVKPKRDQNSRKARREKWWLLGEQAVGMRSALAGLDRYIASGRTAKRLLFAWQRPATLSSDLAYVFAFDDDYAMGVLSSRSHSAWAWARASTLKGDLRYTPTTVFDTFPWPDPVTDDLRERIGAASRAMIEHRQEICRAEQFGLTKLYNLVDDGAYADLKRLHRELDEAVAAAYGWPRSVAQDADEIVRRLLTLNQEIAAGARPYAPFGDSETVEHSQLTLG